MLKLLSDFLLNLVILVVCWISIPLAFFESSLFLDDVSGSSLIYGLFGLFLLNVIVLMWLWLHFVRPKMRMKQ